MCTHKIFFNVFTFNNFHWSEENKKFQCSREVIYTFQQVELLISVRSIWWSTLVLKGIYHFIIIIWWTLLVYCEVFFYYFYQHWLHIKLQWFFILCHNHNFYLISQHFSCNFNHWNLNLIAFYWFYHFKIPFFLCRD